MRDHVLAILVAVALAVPVAATAAEPVGGAWDPGAALGEQAARVPDDQKLERSREAIETMREVLSGVLAKLQDARDHKDVIKLNCVNEKLTQVKGLLKIAESASVALEEAIARKEPEASSHEYLKVAIASQKIDRLRHEAEECVGEIVIAEGQQATNVEVEEPQGLPGSDEWSTETAPPVVRPAPASPTE